MYDMWYSSVYSKVELQTYLHNADGTMGLESFKESF